jgi:hypothetical protein
MDETKDETMSPSELNNDDAAADGYYGEDEMDAEELDLSFLDEEEDDEEKAVEPTDDVKPDASK